jgi:hypothetical protein
MYPFAKITEGGVILILFVRMEDSTMACSSSSLAGDSSATDDVTRLASSRINNLDEP